MPISLKSELSASGSVRSSSVGESAFKKEKTSSSVPKSSRTDRSSSANVPPKDIPFDTEDPDRSTLASVPSAANNSVTPSKSFVGEACKAGDSWGKENRSSKSKLLDRPIVKSKSSSAFNSAPEPKSPKLSPKERSESSNPMKRSPSSFSDEAALSVRSSGTRVAGNNSGKSSKFRSSSPFSETSVSNMDNPRSSSDADGPPTSSRKLRSKASSVFPIAVGVSIEKGSDRSANRSSPNRSSRLLSLNPTSADSGSSKKASNSEDVGSSFRLSTRD